RLRRLRRLRRRRLLVLARRTAVVRLLRLRLLQRLLLLGSGVWGLAVIAVLGGLRRRRLDDARGEQQRGDGHCRLQERGDQHNDQADADVRPAGKADHLEQKCHERDDGQARDDPVVDFLLRHQAERRDRRGDKQQRRADEPVCHEEVRRRTYRDRFTTELGGGTTDIRQKSQEEADHTQRDDADVQEEGKALALTGRRGGAVALALGAITRVVRSLRRPTVTTGGVRVRHCKRLLVYDVRAARATDCSVSLRSPPAIIPRGRLPRNQAKAGGMLGNMAPLLHFAGNFWWLIFPFMGVIGGGIRAIAAANERRAERRL